MKDKTDIISRMEANQARFGRLQLEDRKPCYHIASLGFCPFEKFPSLLQSAEDERREHENDLQWESLMSDEQEHGPVCNLPDDEAWRQ